MKKELNNALRQCAGLMLPDSMVNYECMGATRSKIVFVNSEHVNSGLWLFVSVSSDSKTDSINVNLGWSSDGSVPEEFVFDIRSLDIRGKEIQLETHCTAMPRLYSDIIKGYEVKPIPMTMEDLIEDSKTISNEQALVLVRTTIIKIRSDLNEYAVPYFNWVVENKCR